VFRQCGNVGMLPPIYRNEYDAGEKWWEDEEK
jgi:hypothetical protein